MMEVVEIPIGELHPYESNPRINDDAVEAVANSIREFGFKSPIIVDGDNVIICGHTRLKAAQSLGLDTVPVVVADDLSDEQARAYRLADNKTGEFAYWDWDALASELDGICDIDMWEFGFDMGGGVDDYGMDFNLNDGDSPQSYSIALVLTEEQRNIVTQAMDSVEPVITGGNPNADKICEVCRQWLAQRI